MTFNKIRERTGEIAHLQVAAPAQLVSDIFENVIRPTLCSVEGHDPDRVAVLPGEQVLDDRLRLRIPRHRSGAGTFINSALLSGTGQKAGQLSQYHRTVSGLYR